MQTVFEYPLRPFPIESMKILTKRQADNAILESVFHPAGTLACLKKERFDRGKYKETVIGKDHPVRDGIRLLWAERRRDSDGPYFALFCLHTD